MIQKTLHFINITLKMLNAIMFVIFIARPKISHDIKETAYYKSLMTTCSTHM